MLPTMLADDVVEVAREPASRFMLREVLKPDILDIVLTSKFAAASTVRWSLFTADLVSRSVVLSYL